MRKFLVVGVASAIVLAGTLVAVAQLGSVTTPPSPPATASPPPSPSPVAPDVSPAPPDASPPAPAPAPQPRPPVPVPPPAVKPPAPAPPAPAPAPDPGPPFPGYQPTLVHPRPGMDNPHPVGWTRAEILSAQSVRIHYESGVAPCAVLDRVEVRYHPNRVAITVYEGSDPAYKDAACIMIAQFKAVDVSLSEPLGGRPLVDGSRS